MHNCSKIVSQIHKASKENKRVVFVSGNFNVIHPGHLRILNFAAECGDFLVVGVKENNTDAIIPEELRLEGVNAIGLVDFAAIITCPIEEFIEHLKPDVIVKGKEHEHLINPEQSIVKSYGGKLVFCAGEARFSSLDLLRKELHEIEHSNIHKPKEYSKRHNINHEELIALVHKFTKLNVVVIGDLILDEYITCEPIGMSQEDPTIVVTPIVNDLFVGGGGIVAAHAHGLGGNVHYFGVVGNDENADFAENVLLKQGINVTLIRDPDRPTTLKKRYRANGKTLLRVSHLRQHAIHDDFSEQMIKKIIPAIEKADLLIFSDFNYGCLPQTLVEKVIDLCKKNKVKMVADSQTSSQMGDISRFKDMMLITPTEHEARISAKDKESGLVHLASKLQKKTKSVHIFITLGSEGVLVSSQDAADFGLETDQIPAFNPFPKDVSGAGDCMLTCASMALVCDATVWQSAYLGSLAAAYQVGRVGNLPLKSEEIIQELSS